jgi:hypothetical protein
MQAVLAMALHFDHAKFWIVAKLAGAIRVANVPVNGAAMHGK